MSKKYYILRRLSQETFNAFFYELSSEIAEKIKNRIDMKMQFLLVEKTCNADNTETYTNLWTIPENTEVLYKITKKRQIWDYTGLIKPLIHQNGTVLTFEQYNNK
jgi:hypothetical protein